LPEPLPERQRRARIDAVAQGLRGFGLVDDGSVAALFRVDPLPSPRKLKSALRALRQNRAADYGVVALTILTRIRESDVLAISEEQTPVAIDVPSVEVSLWTVAEFSRFASVPPPSLDLPLALNEDDIKQAFASLTCPLIHQGDWGGETHDLLTSVHVGGVVRTMAFLLKGKSVPRVMQVRDCGRRGDQVQRLFRAPAELFAVQHVHEIGETVRSEAFDQVELLRSRGRMASCCFIDGRDLARLWIGLGKGDR
jgi:hypothetical protein